MQPPRSSDDMDGTPRQRLVSLPKRGDGGYILITLGLFIIPLMIFAALAVDVASWYARTSQMQKAADAAALAGVVWLPDQTQSTNVAVGVLQQDGFVNGSGNITATYTFDSTFNKMTVCVKDAKAPSYFAQVFAGNQSLTRCAVAQYSLPIPLGSPQPYFGGDWTQSSTGTQTTTTQPNTTTAPDVVPCKVTTIASPKTWWNLNAAGAPARFTSATSYPAGSGAWPTCQWTTHPTTGYPTYYTNPGFWANIMGPSSDTDNGDGFSPHCYNSRYCDTSGPGVTNNNHAGHATGYWYTVTVPKTGTSSTIDLQVFDAGHYPGPSSANCTGAPISTTIQRSGTGDNIDCDASKGFTTTYTMYKQDNPLDINIRHALTSSECGGLTPSWSLATDDSPGTYQDKWATLCHSLTIAPGETYLINVNTSGAGDGSNRYALQAVVPGSATVPSTAPTGGPVAISAYADMAVYNNINAGTASFYLAQIGPEYAGKTLDIDLWDTGDVSGNGTMQIIQPGTAQTMFPSCTWDSSYGESPVPAQGSGYNAGGGPPASLTSGSISSGGCGIQVANSGTALFNGLFLHIKIKLPNNYTCDKTVRSKSAALSCWWSVNYVLTAGANDNTTWSAHVEGNPVHLTG